MAQKAPDLAKALVSPMPLHLPFPVPSLFAWVVGMIVAWALLLLLAHVLQDTAVGKRLLLVVPLYLIQSAVILLILVINIGSIPIFSITTADLFIGLLWGAVCDGLLALLWFYLAFRWQDAEVEPRSPLSRPTGVSNTSPRQARPRSTRNIEPRYRITGTSSRMPKPTRARKSLPKRKRISWPNNR